MEFSTEPTEDTENTEEELGNEAISVCQNASSGEAPIVILNNRARFRAIAVSWHGFPS